MDRVSVEKLAVSFPAGRVNGLIIKVQKAHAIGVKFFPALKSELEDALRFFLPRNKMAAKEKMEISAATLPKS